MVNICSYTPDPNILTQYKINREFSLLHSYLCYLASHTGSGLTSVGISMPSAFTVTNSPLTSNGTIAITGAGTTSEYIDGTGALQAMSSGITLTTTGTSGAATLISGTLNIPIYTYTLPQATASVLGGVTIGANISVSSGSISVSGANVVSALGYTPYNSTNPSGYITGNQTITVSGDASGSGTTAITLTLATVNSNIGTFNNVTVNGKGLVTAASNVAYLTANQTITLTGGATGSGTTSIAVTLTNTSVTGQALTGYSSTTGTISATDTILTAIEKLNGNQAALVTGVSAVSNSDSSLTISPTTGAVVASLNVANTNNWTAAQTHTANSLGSGTSAMITLINNTAATSGQTQNSPAIYFTGSGWKTNATAGAETTIMRQYMGPSSSTSQPIVNMFYDYSVNGGTSFTNFLQLGLSAQNLTFPSTLFNSLTANGLEILSSGKIYLSTTSGPHLECMTTNVTTLPQASIVLSSSTGGVSIGTGASPSGTRCQIGASTTTQSHINLTAGVAKTAPANGDIWSDGTNMYLHIAGVTWQFCLCTTSTTTTTTTTP